MDAMTLPTFAALILVAGSTWGDPYTITADEKAAIEAGVLSILRYPESAKFGPMAGSTMRDGSGTVVCGWVNSKNELDAYTGWQIYAGGFVNGKFEPEGGIVDPVGTKFALDHCKEFGVDLPTP